jgi:putative NADH-flavin reductase
MRILILGASGGVGQQLVHQTRQAGHKVTVLTRVESGYQAPPGVVHYRGSVLDATTLAVAMAGQDAVLSALGMRRQSVANPWSPLTSPADFCSHSMRLIVASMLQYGVPRIVAVSAAGVAESAPQMNALMQFFVRTSSIGVAYRDLALMEQVLAESTVDWLAPRPTRLTNGELRAVQVVSDFPMQAAISRTSLAHWMVSALNVPTWPAPQWHGRLPQLAES